MYEGLAGGEVRKAVKHKQSMNQKEKNREWVGLVKAEPRDKFRSDTRESLNCMLNLSILRSDVLIMSSFQ